VLQEGDEDKPMVYGKVRDAIVCHHSEETELLGSGNDSSDGKGDTKVRP